MRAIRKGQEPNSLTRHRASAFADFDNYSDKDGLRSALTREQRGLCCYCQRRIPGVHGMKIEHWHSQSEFPSEQLSYANLLGACTGAEGQPRSKQHCDSYKGNARLSRSPAIPAHAIESFVEYRVDGTIFSRDPLVNSELDEVLHLNIKFLQNNRKAALDGFQVLLGRGELTIPMLERHLREWNGESHAGQLEEYCQVVVYWLRKRLSRSR